MKDFDPGDGETTTRDSLSDSELGGTALRQVVEPEQMELGDPEVPAQSKLDV